MRIVETEKYAQMKAPQALDQGGRSLLRRISPQMNMVDPRLQALINKGNPAQKAFVLQVLSILAEDPSQINKLKTILSQPFMQQTQETQQPQQQQMMNMKSMPDSPDKEDRVGNPFEPGGEAL